MERLRRKWLTKRLRFLIVSEQSLGADHWITAKKQTSKQTKNSLLTQKQSASLHHKAKAWRQRAATSKHISTSFCQGTLLIHIQYEAKVRDQTLFFIYFTIRNHIFLNLHLLDLFKDMLARFWSAKNRKLRLQLSTVLPKLDSWQVEKCYTVPQFQGCPILTLTLWGFPNATTRQIHSWGTDKWTLRKLLGFYFIV